MNAVYKIMKTAAKFFGIMVFAFVAVWGAVWGALFAVLLCFLEALKLF